MIRMRVDHYAESLRMNTSMVVLMPQAAAGIGMAGAYGAYGAPAADVGVPVLYLLHGLSDDCTIWERRTAIERYASTKGIAVVMPEVRRSFYADEALGEDYWTYIADELPQLLARTFRISTAREDTFVAGLSMGGFGAMKLALNRPDRFAAAASLSGVLDLGALDLSEHGGHLAARIWDVRGSDAGPGAHLAAGGPDDLLGLIAAADPASTPALFVACGTEDYLIEGNERFLEVAARQGHAVETVLRPGAHTWEFWDEEIQRVLEWLPLR
ncbi:esterase family protein [Brachybacterium sp. JHP9]|uniref:Esterase family protein n=1 Tax=Brachybacterium equifaecis TaxID=2910770 RepID=A0ABT0R055_9MICO|nr:alpha/beta hydrolase family protein [Brachybacterium equifaecis]MCL6423287.1 esterase family protein [Brachybacterium equifaecis]